MSNDVVVNESMPVAHNASTGALGRALAGAPALNVGAVVIEAQRASAEAQGQMQLALMYPRSMVLVMNEFLEACRSPDFAAKAFYTVKNRGTGPSIRFAEEIARCYGHFDYGHKELSRTESTATEPGKSEVEVYAWDKQKSNKSIRQITIMHVLDTGDGRKILRQQGDIDNRIANVASKQIRGRILALMPKAIVEAGIAECKRTIAGGNEKPLLERITQMRNAFIRLGATDAQLVAYLKHPIDDTTSDELADMVGIYNAIRDGAKLSEYFDGAGEKDVGADITAQARKNAAATQGEQKPAAAAEPATDAKPEAATTKVGAGAGVKRTTTTTTAKKTTAAAEPAEEKKAPAPTPPPPPPAAAAEQEQTQEQQEPEPDGEDPGPEVARAGDDDDDRQEGDVF